MSLTARWTNWRSRIKVRGYSDCSIDVDHTVSRSVDDRSGTVVRHSRKTASTVSSSKSGSFTHASQGWWTINWWSYSHFWFVWNWSIPILLNWSVFSVPRSLISEIQNFNSKNPKKIVIEKIAKNKSLFKLVLKNLDIIEKKTNRCSALSGIMGIW